MIAAGKKMCPTDSLGKCEGDDEKVSRGVEGGELSTFPFPPTLSWLHRDGTDELVLRWRLECTGGW